jgi:hypothetical protein
LQVAKVAGNQVVCEHIVRTKPDRLNAVDVKVTEFGDRFRCSRQRVLYFDRRATHHELRGSTHKFFSRVKRFGFEFLALRVQLAFEVFCKNSIERTAALHDVRKRHWILGDPRLTDVVAQGNELHLSAKRWR